jgi:hypothetical protein
MRVRDRLNVSERRQVQVTRAMEVGLVVILLAGLYRRNIGIVVNSAIALAVTFFPATLERDYDIPMDAGLPLWITSAVFLHALWGTAYLSDVVGALTDRLDGSGPRVD